MRLPNKLREPTMQKSIANLQRAFRGHISNKGEHVLPTILALSCIEVLLKYQRTYGRRERGVFHDGQRPLLNGIRRHKVSHFFIVFDALTVIHFASQPEGG